MRSTATSSARLLLVIVAICYSSATIANASQFSTDAAYSVFGSNGGSFGSASSDIDGTMFGSPDLTGGWITYSGNVTNFVSTTFCDEGICFVIFTGDLNSGSVSFGDSSYAFQGQITGGTITGSYYVSFGAFYETDVFSFTGAWNNGYQGVGGVGIIDVAGGNDGSFSVSTTTPEPGTIVMFGSSLVGLFGVLRLRRGN